MPVRFFRLPRKTLRITMRIALRAATVLGVLVFALCVLFVRLTPSRHVNPEIARKIHSGAADGRLAYRLTEPNEMIRLLGQPTAQVRSDCEGSGKLWLEWPGVGATFVKIQDAAAPTLAWLKLGGMSWAAPYLAGLAAMACQLNPHIDPDTIVKFLLDTATQTDVGRIVNPPGFVEAVKAQAQAASTP